MDTAAAKDVSDLSALLVTLEVQNDRNDEKGLIRKAWVQALRAAHERAGHEVEVTVGPQDRPPFSSNQGARIALRVYPSYTWVIVALLAVLGVGLIRLGLKSNLLRDANGAQNPPYSLARHQMAVWLVVVVGAYLYVWLVTGLFSSISTTALVLIGISGATGLVAVSMDAGKRADAARARIQLQAERDALTQTLDDPVTGLHAQLRSVTPASPEALQLTATLTPKLTRLNELESLLSAPAPAAASNDWWINDLLSDENGISFHRLQILIWTIVLVMVFIKAVYDDVLMPEFDATLLGLLGISSGTYLGFKLPEKPS